MSLYHSRVRVLGKAQGRSAVQFSAYISGTKMKNERTGELYDHTSKEEVSFSQFYSTQNVPQELQEKEKFWNELEQFEKNKNAQFCRTWELALPLEATETERLAMALEFKDGLIKDGYCAVQLAIHDKQGNPHAHIIAPCRQMVDGKWETKKQVKGFLCEDENGKRQAFAKVSEIPPGWERLPLLDENGEQKKDSRNRLQWQRVSLEDDPLASRVLYADQRERWATIQNRYLDQEHQVSHLSYEAQGIDKEPTKHLGYKASQMEKQGIKTEKGNQNREIQARNELRGQIRAQESLLEQLLEMWEDFINGLSRGIFSATERLRGAIESSSRQNRELDTRELLVKAEYSYTNRQDRELERERQRARERAKAEERERERAEAQRIARERAKERSKGGRSL